MRSLNRKLIRDLTSLRGQVITIAAVVACGIASYVTMRSAYDSLLFSRDQFYEQARFAELFARLKRAPAWLESELQQIEGVSLVDTRIVENVLVPMPEMPRPATGVVISSGREGAMRQPLNRIHLTRGRLLDPERHDEALLLQSFADAHGLEPGDSLPVVLNGTLRKLRIAGIVMSAEYVFAMQPGQMTYDPGQVAVLWLNEAVLEAAFQMEGAFNDVVLRLEPRANEAAVLAAIDEELAPYGGLGAILREKQPSHFMLMGELTQLKGMANFVPFLFLSVAALLVNVVLSRLVQLQRSQIATLKAIGYADLDVGFFYLKLVSLIITVGAAFGVGLGAWLGALLTELYTGEFFKFPNAEYRLEFGVAVFAVGISLVSAAIGALIAVRQVVALPPAEAMRPAAPARYRRTLLERLKILHWLGPSTKMVYRELERRPLRLLLSAVGISFAVAILIVARFMYDAIEQLTEVQFHRVMREDLTLTLSKPLPQDVLTSLGNLPGVLRAEGLRVVPVRFRVGHRERESVIFGYPENHELRHLLDVDEKRVVPPRGGLLMTDMLGEVLEAGLGEHVEFEVREGEFRTLSANVAEYFAEPFGMQAYMQKSSLHELLGERPSVNTVLLDIDPKHEEKLLARLKEIPWLAGVSSPREFKEQFEGQSAGMMLVYTLIMTLFAAVIAVGIVYNNARVALSQRSRDLASLRVLGFTRREIASVLFSEQAVQVALAIPLGLVFGNWLVVAMMSTVDPETYRLPVVISERTYAFAVAVALAAAVVSALLVRRRIDRLDLIAVLKTRE